MEADKYIISDSQAYSEKETSKVPRTLARSAGVSGSNLIPHPLTPPSASFGALVSQ